MPEDFEFAACYPCNQSSRIEDKVFGFWAMVLDFDPAKTSNAVDRERIVQLGKEIAKERPQDIEAMNRASPIWMAGRRNSTPGGIPGGHAGTTYRGRRGDVDQAGSRALLP
jgi:hypothetical protein